MKSQFKTITLTIVFFCVSVSLADTFRHRESGDVFVGFATQKVISGKTLVYNDKESQMVPVALDKYEIIPGTNGRREIISLFLLDKPEIFLSSNIADAAINAIVKASNKGPQAILLQIDGPGGRGEAMKILANGIAQTNNCPVIAYISEGAYSATALVSLACDKIYIKSTASIGAIGSVRESSLGGQSYAEYLSTYNLDFQLNDFLYATMLAEKKGRPKLLTRALIDMTISLVEVDAPEGTREIIEKTGRQRTQSLVRTLCEGVSAKEISSISAASKNPTEEPANVTPADFIGKVLNLTANEAIDFGLVDGTAESIQDVLSKEQLSGAKTTPVPALEKTIKKFIAAQRNISEGLYRIDQYEYNIEVLSNQFTEIDNQLRTGTQTREISRQDLGYQSNRRRETYSPYYNEQDIVSSRRSRESRNQSARSQKIVTREPQVNIQTVYTQLTTTLQNAINEYRRVLKIVDRWPGALPAKVSRQMLENDMDSASSELDRLYRYQPTYPSQGQQHIQQNRSTNRRRY